METTPTRATTVRPCAEPRFTSVTLGVSTVGPSPSDGARGQMHERLVLRGLQVDVQRAGITRSRQTAGLAAATTTTALPAPPQIRDRSPIAIPAQAGTALI
jgi:hypothetical protein